MEATRPGRIFKAESARNCRSHVQNARAVVEGWALIIRVRHFYAADPPPDLRRSQSERIVWLFEELGLSYELRCYDRNQTDLLAPPSYKALPPMGIAPVITDGDVVLGESGAIMEYVLAKYGEAGLVRSPQEPDFASYLYWLHFANGTLQPIMGRNMILRRIDLPADHPVVASMRARLDLVLSQVEARCAETTYLAGADQCCRHHERVLAYYDAQLLSCGPRALSADTGLLAAAHRRARRLSARDAQGRPGYGADAELRDATQYSS